MTEEQRQFAFNLKMGVIIDATMAGALGSSEYLAAFNAGIAQLYSTLKSLQQTQVANAGKQVTSVSAGEQVSWSTPMSLQALIGCYEQAIMELMGMTYLQNRTTARFLY